MSQIRQGKGVFCAYGQAGKACRTRPTTAAVTCTRSPSEQASPSKGRLYEPSSKMVPTAKLCHLQGVRKRGEGLRPISYEACTDSIGRFQQQPSWPPCPPWKTPLRMQGEPLAPPAKMSESLPGDRAPCADVCVSRSPEAPDAAAAGVPDGRAQVKESQRGSLTGVGAPSCVRSLPSEQDSWWELSVHAGSPEGKMSCPETLPDLHGCGEATVAQK